MSAVAIPSEFPARATVQSDGTITLPLRQAVTISRIGRPKKVFAELAFRPIDKRDVRAAQRAPDKKCGPEVAARFLRIERKLAARLISALDEEDFADFNAVVFFAYDHAVHGTPLPVKAGG